MTTFVFELGCEELPSSALPNLNLQFQQLFTKHLNEALLRISRSLLSLRLVASEL